ncbi:primosomal protein N' [Corynebacterium cystitidis]|uniref:primosomal protein N' n=1 Tax=Corynebacterium cystitidis TaxID=35757 RepID=UPI00211EF8E3|nr:primosomal protein N' [Corynebacterium cystitidis]
MTDTRATISTPVARVLPLLGLPHLDRTFDYLVKEADSEAAQPGVRVRIRFGGRLVDAFVVERSATSDHEGTLRYIERVISADVVYPPRIRALVDALAERYAGVRSDIVRTAIPPRHAKAEDKDTDTPWEKLGSVTEPDLSAWSAYVNGPSFVDAVVDGKLARAAWQVAPGADWADTVSALVTKVAIDGGGALVVVPDQRDVDAIESALRERMGPRQITVLTASLGPQARYSRYLSVLHGQGRVVVGTRSAAFAPVQDLRLMVLLDDGNDNLVDPRAPYVHAREVLTTRSAIEKVSLIIGGHSRTAETQLLVESGWAHDLVAPREILRGSMPYIHAAGDSDFELARDSRARTARLPSVAFDAARRALARDRPVLFQVPRAGYVQSILCQQCRTPARCRWCNGPLGRNSHRDEALSCRWCGRLDGHYSCPECGSRQMRDGVKGTDRTAEELGRAFPQIRVVSSWGERIQDVIDEGPTIVVATPGAEPAVVGSNQYYGAAVLLDTWALMGRADLRAMEDTMAKWAATVTLVEPHAAGGEVIVVAPPSAPVVQHLIRWDMPGFAARELQARREVGFPPAVHMAAVDAPAVSLERFIRLVVLPSDADVLGPVDLPVGVELPGSWDVDELGPAQRILVRIPLRGRNELGRALRVAAINRAVRKDDAPLRIQVDPIHVG